MFAEKCDQDTENQIKIGEIIQINLFLIGVHRLYSAAANFLHRLEISAQNLIFLYRMKEQTAKKVKPDIRAITRLVPPSGNLVQGQSELPIDPQLASEAAEIIAASQNHYGGREGDQNLRKAVAEKIKKYNGIDS